MSGSPNERLLEWFATNGRDLPWRHTRDPYAILVSEVMLQQTQVERVVPRYLAWLERWPTVEALASAPLADVIREWQGLGYNRRGLNLHRAARRIAESGWPDDLTELPGIGPYTSAALRCFAFGEDVLPEDVNVGRVRRRTGAEFSPRAAQALMDLGATICTPKRPACAICPWLGACQARVAGVQETLPRKGPKAEGALRRGAAFVALRGDDCVLLRTRPSSGLLGGMDEVPTSEWSPDYDAAKALRDAPLEAGWRRLPGLVRHTFTHFPLELTVLVATVAASTPAPAGMRFAPRRSLAGAALPGVMRKVLAHADVTPAAPAPRRG